MTNLVTSDFDPSARPNRIVLQRPSVEILPPGNAVKEVAYAEPAVSMNGDSLWTNTGPLDAYTFEMGTPACTSTPVPGRQLELVAYAGLNSAISVLVAVPRRRVTESINQLPSSVVAPATVTMTLDPANRGALSALAAFLRAEIRPLAADNANQRRAESPQIEQLWRHLQRLEEETSKPNWDFENAPAIPASAWSRARDLCTFALSLPTLPVPGASPCGDGTIHLRWVRDRTRVVVEVGGEHLWWTIRDGARGETSSFSDIIQVLQSALA